MKGYPDWFPRFVIWTMVLLCASGFLLAPTTLEMRLDYAVSWRLGSSLRLAMVASHVFLSCVVLVVFGALWQSHMQAGLRKGRNVYSGLAMASIFMVLTVTGVGVLYFGEPILSVSSSVAHLMAGGLIAGIFFFHVVKGKKMLRSDTFTARIELSASAKAPQNVNRQRDCRQRTHSLWTG